MRSVVARFNFSCNLIGNRPQSLTGHIVIRYRQAKKTTVRRLLAVICAKFAEKVLFAENK